NSAGSFYRGVTIGMPQPHGPTAPPTSLVQMDSRGNTIPTAGLTSITRLDVVGTDGVPDFVFGLPFISGYMEWLSWDPCAGSVTYLDGYPYAPCRAGGHCSHMQPPIDGLTPPFLIDGGLVIFL